MKFTSVKGISEVRRLPRLGIIRLGIKKKSSSGKEYPSETDYFVLTDAPGVEAVFGKEPKEIPIVFPVNNKEIIFPQSLKWYGSSTGLKCQGNGEVAMRYDDATKKYAERSCPCELYDQPKGCSIHGTLSFFIPDVTWGGIYQIRTSSYNSIKNINSALDMYEGMLGRLNMVTFYLTRRESVVTFEGKQRTHYLLGLEFRGSTEDIIKIQDNNKTILLQQPKYQLEAPDETNPEADPVDVEVEEQTYKEETKSYGSIDEAKDEPMTVEQIRNLRILMTKAGIETKEDQQKFFEWWVKNHNGARTKKAGDMFIKDFSKLAGKYLELNGDDAPDFFGDQS